MSFVAELKRRNVIRMAGLYLVGAWLITQVSSTVLPMFGAPDWLPRTVVILLAIGFVPTLIFSWIYELTPEGIKRDADVPPEQSIGKQTGRRIDFAIIAVLLAALVYFAVDKFVLAPHRDSASVDLNAKAANVAAPAAGEPVDEKSIAVLPFTDLSPAHDQEYFSDGMAEEILNALAQVKDLRVAGRTSSFHFKGTNEDLRTVGRALGVASVLEGSVRKQGDKVRITAQLIRVSNGFHLWSHSYDGDLKDVFELQERIARAITDQLQVVIAGDPGTRLVPVATTSPEAHELYLQATTVFNHRDGPHMPEAIAKLKEATRLDPNFARAHARSAALGAILGAYADVDVEQALAVAEREANLAIDLDPTLAEPHAALATIHGYRRHWVADQIESERATTLDPNDSNVMFWRGLFLVDTGYVAAGITTIDKALKIDPLLPNALAWRSFWYLNAGDRENARRDAQLSVEQGLLAAERYLAMIAHAEGRNADAIAQFARGAQYSFVGFPENSGLLLAEGFYGDGTQRARAIAMIDAYLAGSGKKVSHAAPWALLLLQQPDRALAVGQDPRTIPDTLFMSWLWSSWGASARKLPQFPEFARKMGLSELWDQRGPPDGCRRLSPGDYACD
jgi:TolB-like protein/tetratricopeptide (TPR) repeat protein